MILPLCDVKEINSSFVAIMQIHYTLLNYFKYLLLLLILLLLFYYYYYYYYHCYFKIIVTIIIVFIIINIIIIPDCYAILYAILLLLVLILHVFPQQLSWHHQVSCIKNNSIFCINNNIALPIGISTTSSIW